jgi:hypothetical protein
MVIRARRVVGKKKTTRRIAMVVPETDGTRIIPHRRIATTIESFARRSSSSSIRDLTL